MKLCLGCAFLCNCVFTERLNVFLRRLQGVANRDIFESPTERNGSGVKLRTLDYENSGSNPVPRY